MAQIGRSRRWTWAGAAVAPALLIGLLVGGGFGSTVAQEATPVAAAARPAHIHLGTCDNLGEIVYPLTDLTAATGQGVGQRNRAVTAETSFTSVPATLDALLADDHAINVHLSAEEIGTYIACGEIGGVINENGALVIGLGEQNNSGFTGIAYLAPGADGVSTDVSVFIAETERGRRRAAAEATPVGGEEAAETPEA